MYQSDPETLRRPIMETTTRRYEFASDNCSGICPQAWSAMAEANSGYAPAYGDDAWTKRASDSIRTVFDCDCDVFFAFNGTASNSLALASLCQSYHSVIAHEHAHIETDECGGPEFFSNGTKILLVGGSHGKLDIEAVETTVRRRSDIHYPKPRALSITQPTELGTVYSLDELKRINEVSQHLGLNVHMDGSRLANALDTLNVPPSEITWKVGVDVLCLGGTKNGMGVGDCIIFFNRALSIDFAYRCKQAGQLASKMRYLAAPWIGLLENDTWLKNAHRANQMAQYLRSRLCEVQGIEIIFPVEANSVFVRFPPDVTKRLRQEGWQFYNFIGAGGSRLMCSWSTTDKDVDEFCGVIKGCQAVTTK